MFFSEHRLKIASLRIGKHRIVKNIASLRKVNIAHPSLTVKRPFFLTTSLSFCCCSVHKPNKHPGTLTIYGLHTVRLATFANSAQNSSSWKGVCWWVASMKYIFVCKPHKIFGVALMEYRNPLRKMRWERCPWKMVRIVGWLCWCSEMRSCTCRG